MKKTLILLAILVGATGCSTVKQAQTDFQNFRKTIQFNANMPAVYKQSYF